MNITDTIYISIIFVIYMAIRGINSSKNKKNNKSNNTLNHNEPSNTSNISNIDNINNSNNYRSNTYNESHFDANNETEINLLNLFNKGRNYENEGNYEKAIRTYNEILRRNLTNVDVWIRKAICLYKMRKFVQSIECTDKILSIDKKNYMAWFFKGNALMDLKKYDEALICYTYALNLAPVSEKAKILHNKILSEKHCNSDNDDFRTVKSNIKKGRDLLFKKDYNNALIEFKKVLMKDACNIEALFGAGYCLNELGKYNDAIGYWDKYLKLNPKDSNGWFNKGTALYHLRDHSNAYYCFKKVIELNPKDLNTNIYIITMLMHRKKYNEALKYIDDLLNITQNWKLWKIKGDIYYSMKQYNNALKSYNNALKYVRDVEDIYISLGNTYKNLGDFKNALKCYNLALKLNPKNIIVKNIVEKINNMVNNKTEEYINLAISPTVFYFNEWNEVILTITNKTNSNIKNVIVELNNKLFDIKNIDTISRIDSNSSVEVIFQIKPKKKKRVPYEIKLNYEKDGHISTAIYEEYVEIVESNISQKSLGKEIYYCGDLVLINLKCNDLYRAMGYLYDLKKYAEKNGSDLSKDLENILNEINYRITHNIGNSDDLYKRLEILIERIKLGN
jgi:tetratricopeptide (TPR) repeat protein